MWAAKAKMRGGITSRQRGAYLIIMAILVVALIAVCALAIDVGRVLVLRAEMQNAADAAAMAAAVELDGTNDAQERARNAAQTLLEHNAHFSKVNALLGEEGIPDEAFEFFCVIGSQFDVEPDIPGFSDVCSGGNIETDKYLATEDADSHYVRVTLGVPEAEQDRFTTELLFLPVLAVLGLNPQDEVTLQARALAGRKFFTCDYPPVALCDPWENSGGNFRDNMPLGGHIQLRQQGSNQWSHGNFGFLEPFGGGSGATDVAEYIADEGLTDCTPPIVTTQTGSMSQKTAAAFNTRMDVYGPPSPFNQADAPDNWPPAPNVMEYPLDATTVGTDSRFGTGDWDFSTYWATHHPGVPPGAGNWANPAQPQRWEVYNWEIANGAIPPAGEPDPSHIYTGDYPPPPSVPERRLFYVGVLSCEALGLTGGKKTSPLISDPDGFAKIFMIRQAVGPPVGEVYAEYVGWGEESDGNYHVDIQLYE